VLITERTPDTCLYWDKRAESSEKLFETEEFYYPNQRHKRQKMEKCRLLSLMRLNSNKWDEYPKDKDECEKTEGDVQFMKWGSDKGGGHNCILPLPVRDVSVWQTARNNVFEACILKLVDDIPIMCFQEVDSSNLQMLREVRNTVNNSGDSNKILEIFSDVEGKTGVSTMCKNARGLAILYDSAVIRVSPDGYTEYENEWDLPCTQILRFEFERVNYCLCNIHAYVGAEEKERHLLYLLEHLRSNHQGDHVFIFSGDMNQSYDMADPVWKAKLRSHLDHVLVASEDYPAKLDEVPHIKIKIQRCINCDHRIKMSLDQLEKNLQKTYNGGGHVVGKRDFLHWVSDHKPVVVKLNLSNEPLTLNMNPSGGHFRLHPKKKKSNQRTMKYHKKKFMTGETRSAEKYT